MLKYLKKNEKKITVLLQQLTYEINDKRYFLQESKKSASTVALLQNQLKLQAVGVMGDAYNWILDYLKDRSQFTTVNDSSSTTKPINYGVPQGSLLGPRLYSIM